MSYEKAREAIITRSVQPTAQALANFFEVRYIDAAIIITQLERDNVISYPDSKGCRVVSNR